LGPAPSIKNKGPIMQPRSFLLALLACIGVAASAYGNVLIEIGDLELYPDQTGFVDVLIAGDSNDLLGVFNFEFLITPVGGTTTELAFVDPQSDPQLGAAAYVFF